MVVAHAGTARAPHPQRGRWWGWEGPGVGSRGWWHQSGTHVTATVSTPPHLEAWRVAVPGRHCMVHAWTAFGARRARSSLRRAKHRLRRKTALAVTEGVSHGMGRAPRRQPPVQDGSSRMAWTLQIQERSRPASCADSMYFMTVADSDGEDRGVVCVCVSVCMS